MSARKPTWRMELDQREQDLLFRIGQLQDDICAVSRAVGEAERRRCRLGRAMFALYGAVLLLMICLVILSLNTPRKQAGWTPITPSASYDLGPTITQQPGCSQVALDAAQNVFTRRCI